MISVTMLPMSPQSSPSSPQENLLAYSAQSMATLIHNLHWPRYRAQQILHWLYKQRIHTIDDMTNLSVQDRAILKQTYTVQRFQRWEQRIAHDGTQKCLAHLEDGLMVEAVLIPDDQRLTLCLSTQVGCTLDCTFCLTGQLGLQRNLKSFEIIDQVLTTLDHLPPRQTLTNFVLMGMGESMANFDAVAEAIHRMTNSAWGLGISPKRITLSTAGLVSRLDEVAALGVNLAISLNATTDKIREQLMPTVNKLFPLEHLLQICKQYPLLPRQRLTFEYVLLAGINDTREDAVRLGKLLRGISCKVNLIPFNEFPGSQFVRPQDSEVLRFQHKLKLAGIPAFIRKSKGRDVLGACGQLGNGASLSPTFLTPRGGNC